MWGSLGGESLGEGAVSPVQRQPLRRLFTWLMVSIFESVLNPVPEGLPWVGGRGWGGDGRSFGLALPALRTGSGLGAGKPSGLAAEADSSLGCFLEPPGVCPQLVKYAACPEPTEGSSSPSPGRTLWSVTEAGHWGFETSPRLWPYPVCLIVHVEEDVNGPRPSPQTSISTDT